MDESLDGSEDSGEESFDSDGDEAEADWRRRKVWPVFASSLPPSSLPLPPALFALLNSLPSPRPYGPHSLLPPSLPRSCSYSLSLGAHLFLVPHPFLLSPNHSAIGMHAELDLLFSMTTMASPPPLPPLSFFFSLSSLSLARAHTCSLALTQVEAELDLLYEDYLQRTGQKSKRVRQGKKDKPHSQQVLSCPPLRPPQLWCHEGAKQSPM